MGGKRILEQAIEFEGIVNNIFKEAGYETNTFDYYRDHLYDIEAKKGEEIYCIEIKLEHHFRYMRKQLQNLSMQQIKYQGYRFLLSVVY